MGGVAKTIESALAPVVDLATVLTGNAELLPIIAPAIGAVGGGLTGGGQGALVGGLEGLVGGQLGGTGELAPLSTSGAGDSTGIFGLGSTGSESAIGQLTSGIGNLFSGSTETSTAGATPGISPTPNTAGSSSMVGGAPAAPTGGSAPLPVAPAGVEAQNLPVTQATPQTAPVSYQGVAPQATPALNVPSALPASSPGSITAPSGGTFDLQSPTPAVNFGGTQVPPASPTPTGGTGLFGMDTPVNEAPAGVASTAAAPTGAAAPSTASQIAKYAIPAAGLAYSALTANQQPKGMAQLQQEAAAQATQGQQLESYLTTGTLPPGIQDAINTATEQAKAAVRSKYANLPGSSSAEAQDLAAVDEAAISQGASIAMQLLQSGLSESNLASTLYGNILQAAMQQDTNLGNAIVGFGSSLVGSSPGTVTLKVA